MLQHVESAAGPRPPAVGAVPPPLGLFPVSEVLPLESPPRGAPPPSVPVELPLEVPAALGAPVTATIISAAGSAGLNVWCSSPISAAAGRLPSAGHAKRRSSSRAGSKRHSPRPACHSHADAGVEEGAALPVHVTRYFALSSYG
jgi:hypothetical protein